MLIRNPGEFERVAQEWAVKYAGAPKRERGEGSGGSATETKKQLERRSKAEEEAERVAKYGLALQLPQKHKLTVTGTEDTIKT